MAGSRITPNSSAPRPTGYQTLAQQDRGEDADTAVHEGVPAHLRHPLQDWLDTTLESPAGQGTARRVLSQLRIAFDELARSPGNAASERHAVADLFRVASRRSEEQQSQDRFEALDVINAVIGAHPDDGRQWDQALQDLDERLADAGSVWTVSRAAPVPGLVRRVDPVATNLRHRTGQDATAAGRPNAARHLDTAWKRVYGQQPDFTASYHAAVLAVEAAACPVLLATASANGTATIHMALKHLTDAPHKWVFALAEERTAAVGSIDPVQVLLRRLLRGETGRHDADGAGIHNRSSTRLEAETALHAATALVHWFASGAVQPAP